jgi:hypothetical protein
MTNILINLIIAYTEHLSRLEARTRKQATTAASPARIRYIHNRADAIAAERAVFEAMLRVYLASGDTAHSRRRAA